MAGVLLKRGLKKDMTKMDVRNSPTGLNMTKESRPSSASSVSTSTSKASKSSASQKSHGPTKEQLLKANNELTREVETLNEENQLLKATITAIIDKFIENAKIKGVSTPKEIDRANVCDIPVESLVSWAEQLTAERHKSNTMEGRVEEMETRITHLNVELAKLLRTRINVENGLEQLAECSSLDEAQSKARDLILELQSTSLFTFLDTIGADRVAGINSRPGTNPSVEEKRVEKQSPIKPHPRKTIPVLLQDDTLDLSPPSQKSPGDTHIRNMHKDLRKYIAQQLSYNKANGADWRMFAERVGISGETVQQWKRWKVEVPMQSVLQAWGQSPNATVRLLHRHLISPQMRNTILAKRVSDFYQVD